jgi:hypothetical protein
MFLKYSIIANMGDKCKSKNTRLVLMFFQKIQSPIKCLYPKKIKLIVKLFNESGVAKEGLLPAPPHRLVFSQLFSEVCLCFFRSITPSSYSIFRCGITIGCPGNRRQWSRGLIIMRNTVAICSAHQKPSFLKYLFLA